MTALSLNGLLMGAYVGSTVGFPLKGLSTKQASRLTSDQIAPPVVLGHLFYAEDMAVIYLMAKSLLKSNVDVSQFQDEFGQQLRRWVSTFPAAISPSLLSSGLRLMQGVPASESGGAFSDSEPALRCAMLGLLFGNSPKLLSQWVLAATSITHADYDAYYGALAIACAAATSAQMPDAEPLDLLSNLILRYTAVAPSAPSNKVLVQLRKMHSAIKNRYTVARYATAIGEISAAGVAAHVNHAVPLAIFAWLKSGANFEKAIQDVVKSGGATHLTAALTGALIGAGHGSQVIPNAWTPSNSFNFKLFDPLQLPTQFEQLAPSLAQLTRSSSPSSFTPSHHSKLRLINANTFRFWVKQYLRIRKWVIRLNSASH